MMNQVRDILLGVIYAYILGQKQVRLGWERFVHCISYNQPMPTRLSPTIRLVCRHIFTNRFHLVQNPSWGRTFT